ncbi:GNAT family N-acetyltransferase [Streptomyces platensis]|uniref:GNAT family N-acetyltransferase n=1 Tax=Streptomyces platensis TaxID=58346 RepID=UPI002E137623|nr:GNAT family N-acetyltransferase [Streptomyces platensis]WTI52614.1 GNAT family N-acetyltransferase [Streptomyces platensis]WUB81748.1 GNAT family N-acetyltransferase [Streptomyces platensis]
MTAPVKLQHYSALSEARQNLISLYADVRAELLHLPNYRVDVFAERLDRHAVEPGWQAVIAYAGDATVGYAYANTVQPDDRWWGRMTTPAPAAYAAAPAVAVKEIGVTTPWRGKGVARRIHDALLATRSEPNATLMVNPAAGDGKVQRLYERWGYAVIGAVQPSPESPVLACMARPVRHGER